MTEIEKLQAEIDRLTDENQKLTGTVKHTALEKALSQAGAVKPSMLAEILAGEAEVLDGKEVGFTDEFGGTLSVEDGVKHFLTANPEFLPASAHNEKQGKVDASNMSMAEYVKARNDGKIK